MASKEIKIIELLKDIKNDTQKIQPHETKKISNSNDKNYELVKEIVNLLSKKKLLVHEAYEVIEQVKNVLGYTPI